MKHPSRLIWMLLCALPMSALASNLANPATDAPVLTESQWSALQSGQPVLLDNRHEQDPRAILGAILVDTPVQSTWHVINDKEKGPEFTKGLLRAKVLEEGESHMLVEQDMKVGVIPGVFTYVMRHDMQPLKRVDFARKSGDLKEVKGYWKFIPVEGNSKTLLVYSLFIDPGFFLPRGIMERSMKKKVPEALVEIKERTETIHPSLSQQSGDSIRATVIPQ